MLIAEGVPGHVSVGEDLSEHRLEARPTSNSFQSMPIYAALQDHKHKPHRQLELGDLELSHGSITKTGASEKICSPFAEDLENLGLGRERGVRWCPPASIPLEHLCGPLDVCQT